MASGQDSSSRRVSRDAVLAVLRASVRPQPIDVIAEAVGLGIATTRFHLDHLRDAGLVKAAPEVRNAPGRPRVLYRAVPAEAVDEGAAYRMLAGLLAAELVQAGDPSAPLAAGRAWADRLLGYAPGTSEDQDAAVAYLLTLFEDGGFAPEYDRQAATIALHACPFMTLAAEQPDIVCAVHLGMARRVLEQLTASAAGGSDGRRLHLRPVLDGSGPCVIRLPRPRAARPANSSPTTTTDVH